MQFTHLHVASSFSLRYGTTPPARLVEHAKAQGYGRLAVTDRDGLYGAVKFVEACRLSGLELIVGVDLALEQEEGVPSSCSGRRSPVKGGQRVDDTGPRVTVLAYGAAAGVERGIGWARLCRLVTDAHLGHERGRPRTSASRQIGRAHV